MSATGALPTMPPLTSLPALERPDLLAAPVAAALAAWEYGDRVAVVEIDPELADTEAMTQAYGVPLAASANCVLIAGRRGGAERVAACLVRADTRTDVNNRVRRLLDVRKASFLDTDRAVAESGMEYGAINPIGVPADWRVLVDTRVTAIETAIIGTGLRRSKLLVPGRLLAELPGTEIVDELALE